MEKQRNYLIVLNGNELLEIKATGLRSVILMLAKYKHEKYMHIFNLEMFEIAIKGCETSEQMIRMYNTFSDESDVICDIIEISDSIYENPEMTPIECVSEYKEL